MLLCCHGSQKFNHEWGLQQLLEVWTNTFKSSAAAEDDVQEDDVEMTVEGAASSAGDPADEDPFEMCRQYKIWQTTGSRSTRGVDERKTNSLHL
jgi:hypothetical protein